MNKINLLATIGLGLTLITAGCGHSDSGSSYLIKQEEVSKEGCLNMELVTKRFRQFPAGVYSRRSTVGVRASGEGSAELTATKGAYKFEEGLFTELTKNYPDVTQAQCSSVSFLNSEGEGETFEIKNYGPDFVVVQQGEARKKLFRLIDPQTLREETQYATFNPCGAVDEISVTAGYQFRWGPQGEIAKVSEERISQGLIKTLERATAISGANLPGPSSVASPTPTPVVSNPSLVAAHDEEGNQGVYSLLSESGDEAPVPVSQLRELYEAQLDPSHLYCVPLKGKPVSVDPDADIEEDNQWGGGHSRHTENNPSPSPTPNR